MNPGSSYTPGREIARGGMGVILSATDQTLDREVAMKVILLDAEASAEARQRFVREALVLARLEHPNIVPIHEMGRNAEGQLFYTMKLVKGRTLHAILKGIKEGDEATVKHYTLDRLLTIYRKVCDAMAFAHHQRIIHRDLKPENVMVGEFGEVLVMDWGLAKHLDDQQHAKTEAARAPTIEGFQELSDSQLAEGGSGLTLDGSVMGSPQYMPPEQAEGRLADIGPHSDIYALGGILYTILTLRPPVEGRKVREVLDNVKSGRITPPTTYNVSRSGGVKLGGGTVTDVGKITGLPHCPDGKVPASLSAVTMRAMAFKPADRYASVGQITADVEAYQGGFATSAEQAGALKQAALFIRRNKAASIGVAAVLLIGGTFGTKAVLAGRRATAALAELRATAPTFAAQATALVETQKFDEALEKLGFALKLDPDNADYHLARANTLQALTRLTEAAESYRRVVELRGNDAAAKANRDLCEKLLSENGGNPALAAPLKTKLLDAILAQKRQADAVPLSRELKRDTDTAETLIKTRLKAVAAQPGWDARKLNRLADGTFKLDLSGLKVPDLAVLNGLPISDLSLGGFQGVDLTPLRQVPLRSLALGGCKGISLDGLRGMKLTTLELESSDVTNLSPLAGMPLERLNLKACPVTDLTPLRGMPLQYLDLTYNGGITDFTPLRGLPLRTLLWKYTSMRNLSALRGAPLETLQIQQSAVETLDGIQGAPLRTLAAYEGKLTDISALRGLPLSEADLGGSPITDLTPLADCQKLERLLISTRTSDIAFLKKLPNLKRIGYGSMLRYAGYWGRVPTAEDFWKKNGERLARQVPMEKQLEKFRQSLIAQGNAPDTVPRFAFDVNGGLSISIPKELKCTDISELRGVAVTGFWSKCGSLRDLSPLAGAPLREVGLGFPSAVVDLSPLRGAPLNVISLEHVSVTDISALRGMPLIRVSIEDSPVADVSPLADIPTLEEVRIPPTAKNIETLRGHRKIALLSYWVDPKTNRPTKTAAEFWKEFDAKQAAGKK